MKKLIAFLMALGMVLAIIPMESAQGRGGRGRGGGRSGGLRRSGGSRSGKNGKNAQIYKDRTTNEYDWSFDVDCKEHHKFTR